MENGKPINSQGYPGGGRWVPRLELQAGRPHLRAVLERAYGEVRDPG